jgi:hypothetical protein
MFSLVNNLDINRIKYKFKNLISGGILCSFRDLICVKMWKLEATHKKLNEVVKKVFDLNINVQEKNPANSNAFHTKIKYLSIHIC